MIARLMTKSEYARHRGVSPAYISKLIKNGKIILEYDGKIDPGKADISLGEIKNQATVMELPEPRKVGRPKLQPVSELSEISIYEAIGITNEKILKSDSYFEAQKFREIYNALLKKMEYELLRETLIPSIEVKKEIYEANRIIRDIVINIPQRICSGLPCSDEVRFAVEQALKIEINLILAKIK